MKTILFPEDKQESIEDIVEVEVPEHSCGDPKGYFLVDNALSELADEYQRSRARKNLGLVDTGDVVLNAEWGHIIGDVQEQEDLMHVIKDYAYGDSGVLSDIQISPSYITSDIDKESAIHLRWTLKKGVNISAFYINVFKGEDIIHSGTLTGDSSAYSFTVDKGPIDVQIAYMWNNKFYSKTITIEDKPVIKYTDSQGVFVETNDTSFIMDTSNTLGRISFNKNRNYQIAVDGIVGGFMQESQAATYVTYRTANSGLVN